LVERIDCCTRLFTCIGEFLVSPAVHYVVQLTNETGKDVTEGLKTKFRQKPPKLFDTDAGKEFRNKHDVKYFQKAGVCLVHS